MRTSLILSVVCLSACIEGANDAYPTPAVTPDPNPVTDPDAPQALADCAEDGLVEVSAVDAGLGQLVKATAGPDGSLVLATADGQLALWRDGEVRAIWAGEETTGITAIGADGDRMVVLDNALNASLLDLNGNTVARTAVTDVWPSGAVVSPDARTVLFPTLYEHGALWNTVANQVTPIETELTGLTDGLWLETRGELITAGHVDWYLPGIEIRDASNPSHILDAWPDTLLRCGASAMVTVLDANLREDRLLVAAGGGGYGELLLFDLDDTTDPLFWEYTTIDPIAGALLPGDDVIALIGAYGDVALFSTDDGALLSTTEADDWLVGGRVDATQVVSASWEGTVTTYACPAE